MEDAVGLPVYIFIYTMIVVIALSAGMTLLEENREDSIITNELELISVTGEFNSDTLNRIHMQLSRYGEFNISIRLDEKMATQELLYDKHFKESYILNRKLRIGDRVHLMVEKCSESMLERVVNGKGILDIGYQLDTTRYKYFTVPIVRDGE